MVQTSPDERQAPQQAGLGWMDVLPILPPRTDLWSSNLFWPGLMTAAVGSYLFFAKPGVEAQFRIIAYYIVGVVVIASYINSGSRYRLLTLLYASGLTALILLWPLVMNALVLVFQKWPGLQYPASPDFVPKFLYFFPAVGLMEELIKAVPALTGLAFGLIFIRHTGPAAAHLNLFSVRNPLDGMLMGIAAGGAFTLFETLERYIPKVRLERARMIEEAVAAQSGGLDAQASAILLEVTRIAAQTTGLNDAFLVLMPRLLGSLAGHMAYAAIFGYFIGLAALHRRHILPLLVLGWIAAAAMHGAWNAASTGPGLALLAGSSFLAFMVYFLKAGAMALADPARA